MRAIIVKPGEEPKVSRIGDSLEEMQAVVGGYIEVIRFHAFDGRVALISNEEGRLLGLPENRLGIRGTCFICGVNGTEITDIPEDLIDKTLEFLTWVSERSGPCLGICC